MRPPLAGEWPSVVLMRAMLKPTTADASIQAGRQLPTAASTSGHCYAAHTQLDSADCPLLASSPTSRRTFQLVPPPHYQHSTTRALRDLPTQSLTAASAAHPLLPVVVWLYAAVFCDLLLSLLLLVPYSESFHRLLLVTLTNSYLTDD